MRGLGYSVLRKQNTGRFIAFYLLSHRQTPQQLQLFFFILLSFFKKKTRKTAFFVPFLSLGKKGGGVSPCKKHKIQISPRIGNIALREEG